jgi:hypothetical protein
MNIFRLPHTMNDVYFIEIIVRKIEKKLNWKKVVFWTDNEYKKLSLLIYKDTTISISPQTLKRLFGKIKYKDIYTPQPATKDALARFLKYDDWEAFVQDQAGSRYRFTSFLNKWEKAKGRKRILILSVFTFITGLAVFIVSSSTGSRTVFFYADHVTGITPHTVSFHYDISHLKYKEVYIDFDQKEAEDNSPGELLDKNRTLINHCFESPGFFNVTLSSHRAILTSVKIHVLSDGWASYYFNDDNFSLRKFVFGLEKKVRDTVNDGLLYISPKELNNQGFNGNTVFYLEHMVYQDFHVSADSCTLEVRYKNSPELGGISCYDAEFRIVGENGLASAMLVQKGCYRWSEITVGEKHLNGKYNDLSSFSTDLSSWNFLRIKMDNGKAFITNGNDTIFTCAYIQPLGMVKGIRLITKGSGAFDYVRLYNGHGRLNYSDDFGNGRFNGWPLTNEKP